MPELTTQITDNRLISGSFGPVHFGTNDFGPVNFGPWGFEASDRVSFLTLDDNSRHVNHAGTDINFKNSRWRLEYQTRPSQKDTAITISARFTALTGGPLQDAVIRLVFDKTAIDHGMIANQKYHHRNSDKYRLFPTRQVQLHTRDDRKIDVTLDHAEGAGRFAPYMYLRDRDESWIIHARLLPIAPIDDIWLRWANRLFTLTCPQKLARLIWKAPGGKAILWRLREKWGRHAPEIQAVPLNILKPGQSLYLEVTCRFH
ncbi:hypothetical protein [Thalassospira mesophila]|uniref:Uncharacterized protein n=1 Tax=Thalassospira mesophila TaxID=1293891 RepID=A0A1Y2L5E2_9PROT|nr:hypothetical protein [Thalassospira mesophila]OSQ39753.1 hypothetical protein TMES_07320 [Thalassospira mesophila]